MRSVNVMGGGVFPTPLAKLPIGRVYYLLIYPIER